jgi:hypothetical protein
MYDIITRADVDVAIDAAREKGWTVTDEPTSGGKIIQLASPISDGFRWATVTFGCRAKGRPTASVRYHWQDSKRPSKRGRFHVFNALNEY